MKVDRATDISVMVLRSGASIRLESEKNSLTMFMTLEQLTDLSTVIDTGLKKAAELNASAPIEPIGNAQRPDRRRIEES